MNLRRVFVLAALTLGVNGQNSCCFVAQNEAQEVIWVQQSTETLTSFMDMTVISTLLTPLGTTTITNLVTKVVPTSVVITTSSLVTPNPVSLYPNPAFTIPQSTEILTATAPTQTGGTLIAAPTGFWVYTTAKVFAAPAITDSNGNVACGTLSSFSSAASDPAACVQTFTGINSNAAALFQNNGVQAVTISLTTPFVYVPTRAGLQVSPTEACVQGSGTENYGYPAQQLINHLVSNPLYSAQWPGLENCIPAGPTIQAEEILAAPLASTTDPSGNSTSTETGVSGGLPTSSTTITMTANSTVTSTTTPTTITTSPISSITTLPISDLTSTPAPTSSPEVGVPSELELPSSTTSTSPTSIPVLSEVSSSSSSSSIIPPTSTFSPSQTPISSTAPLSDLSGPTTTAVTIPPGQSTSVAVSVALSSSSFSILSTAVSNGTTAVVVIAPTGVTSQSARDYVPWKLMASLFVGLIAIRV